MLISHRNAANLYDATCAWSGQLPPRSHKNPIFSCKIFLGGVPWDLTEATLVQTFKPFGPIQVNYMQQCWTHQFPLEHIKIQHHWTELQN